ncbi:MAG: hypothetical protein SCM11_17505, partial [Bacillota bacterium]|nr:hypothetical protein [Bacillota bacterium]
SEVGNWTSQNREGLFGTRGSPCHHDFLWGSMTSKGTQLYCFPDDNQKGKLTINGLNTPVRRVVALEQDEPVPFSQTPLLDSTSLTLDLVLTPAYRPAYRIELETEPVFSDRILMQDENQLALYPHLASANLAGQPFKVPQHGLGDRYKKVTSVAISSAGTLIGWSDSSLILCWDAWITATGSYKVQLQMPVHYKQNPVKRNHKLIMKVEQEAGSGQTTWSSVLDSGLADADEALDLQAGYCRLTLQVTSFEHDQDMSLQCITLTPLA